jgi:multiple sugar transport system permease protein
MLAPGLIIALGTIFIPVLYAISLSFYHAESFIAPFSFVGLRNYVGIFTERRYWEALEHGLIYALVTVSLQLVIGIGIASVLNQQFAGRNLLRGVALLPYVLPTVSAAYIWRWILDPNNGLVASALTGFGLPTIDWFGTPLTAWISILFISVWQWTPFVTIAYLAGLQGVSAELYEAAKLDGATNWQCFVRITLPVLKPVLVVILLLRGIFMFNKFDMIWLLTAGGPLNATENLAILAYQKTFNTFDIGGGAAVACSIFLVLTSMIWLVFKLVPVEDAA